jgi:ATP-dependent DNA helicase RecQ
MGALMVTERARPVLDGDEKVELRRMTVTPARARKARGAKAPTGAPENLTDADKALFEVLRDERRVLADAEGVPAYVVLPDRTLWELVAARPSSTDELLAVNGIGPVKAEKYGARFLELLADA